MKFTKNNVRSLLIVLIIVVIYNVIAFVAPFVRGVNFWVGYSFSMFAVLLVTGVGFYAVGSDGIKSKFYGLSILRIAWIYLIIEIIVGFLFMAFPEIPIWLSVVISTILLGACLIGLISVDMGKEEIERIDESVKEKVFYIKSLQVDVEGLPEKTDDFILKKSLKDLSETIKYSDPMSSSQLSTIEAKIEAKIAELIDAVDVGNTEISKNLSKSIQLLFDERNKKCKLLK